MPLINSNGTTGYDLGGGGNQWRDLYWAGRLIQGGVTRLDASGNLTVNSCVGCGGAGVSNGFFVTGQSVVAPPSTAVGLQVYHDPGTHASFIKSYSTGAVPTAIDFTGLANFNQVASFQGGISMGSTPTITNAFSGAAMNIIGSTTGNGNILITPGTALGGNNSLRVSQVTNGQPAMILKGIGGSTASTILEIQDGSVTTARFWVEAGGNSTTSTGCPNCVHTASIFPATDGSFDVGADTFKYRLFKGYGIQLGQIPTDIPSGATAQIVQNGSSFFVVDALSAGIPAVVFRRADGSYLSPAAVGNAVPLGVFSARGFDGTWPTSSAAGISFFTTQAWNTSAHGAEIHFTATALNSTTAVQTFSMNTTGLIPAQDATYALGTGSFRFLSANIVNLTVGSCSGCGAPADMMTTDTAQTVTGSKTFTNTNTFSSTLSANGGITMTGTSSISSGNSALVLQGAFFNNGNILLNPGNVSGNSSVVITAPQQAQPALYLVNASGSGSGFNVFEIRNPSGTPVFKVVSSGDPFPNSLVSYTHFPHDTSQTDNLGDINHRWGKLWAANIDVSGNSTIVIGSGNFYNRTFFGTPSCSGVSDGWMGIDVSASKIWVCVGGVARSASLF